MKKMTAVLLALAVLVGMVSLPGCTPPEDVGNVYYLNFKPEADEAWQKLAHEYTELTGVQVKVETVTDGDYQTRLTARMAGDQIPTLFQVTGHEELAKWEDYALDLTQSQIFANCGENGYYLTDAQERVRAIGYCYEVYGIIVNKALLEQAGHRVEQITNFATLKAVAEDITARKTELGFAAFTSAGLGENSSWRFTGHLANMPLFYELRDMEGDQTPGKLVGQYMYAYQNLWDLYLENAVCAPEEMIDRSGFHARNEFIQEEAVFYQNGSWEYASLLEGSMEAESLTMIPLYCGVPGEENAGLCMGTENYWVVNAKASEADREATLAFLEWVSGSDSGKQMLAYQFGGVPFVNGPQSENPFILAAQALAEQEKYPVSWEFTKVPNAVAWREKFLDVLTRYTRGEAPWISVQATFADAWNEETEK